MTTKFVFVFEPTNWAGWCWPTPVTRLRVEQGKREWQLCEWKLNVWNKLMQVTEGHRYTHTHTHSVSTRCNKATTWPEGMEPVWTASHQVWRRSGHTWMKGTVKKKKEREWWRDRFLHAGNRAFYTSPPSWFFFSPVNSDSRGTGTSATTARTELTWRSSLDPAWWKKNDFSE